MALLTSSYHRSWYTGDATANTWVQDFSSLVLAPGLPGGEIALWPIISKLDDGFEAGKFEWVEEANTTNTITSASTTSQNLNLTTGGTATTALFAASGLSNIGARPGILLRNKTDRTKKEIILVSTVDSSTQATVVRDYGGHVSGSGGGTTGESHAIADVFEVCGYLNFQGSSVPTGTYDAFATRARATAYNYYSLLDDYTRVAAEDLVREYRGSSPDNWGYQINGLVTRLNRIFEAHLIDSPLVAPSSTARGSMGGIRWFATQSTQTTAAMYSSTSETFSYEVWDDAMKAIFNVNGQADAGDWVTVLSPAAAQTVPYIHESAQRMEYANEYIRGMRATGLMSTLTGARIPIVVSQKFPTDAFAIINVNAMRVHFLRGRALKIYTKEEGQNLDAYRAARYMSAPTFEVQRPTENLYYHDGVTFTRPS